MKKYEAYIVANNKETPLKQATPAHYATHHCLRVYEVITDKAGDDEFIVAEFYGKDARENTNLFLNAVDSTRISVITLGYYLSTDIFEELEDAYYKLISVVDKNKSASDYVNLADFVNDSMTVEELLYLISVAEIT